MTLNINSTSLRDFGSVNTEPHTQNVHQLDASVEERLKPLIETIKGYTTGTNAHEGARILKAHKAYCVDPTVIKTLLAQKLKAKLWENNFVGASFTFGVLSIAVVFIGLLAIYESILVTPAIISAAIVGPLLACSLIGIAIFDNRNHKLLKETQVKDLSSMESTVQALQKLCVEKDLYDLIRFYKNLDCEIAILKFLNALIWLIKFGSAGGTPEKNQEIEQAISTHAVRQDTSDLVHSYPALISQINNVYVSDDKRSFTDAVNEQKKRTLEAKQKRQQLIEKYKDNPDPVIQKNLSIEPGFEQTLFDKQLEFINFQMEATETQIQHLSGVSTIAKWHQISEKIEETNIDLLAALGQENGDVTRNIAKEIAQHLPQMPNELCSLIAEYNNSHVVRRVETLFKQKVWEYREKLADVLIKTCKGVITGTKSEIETFVDKHRDSIGRNLLYSQLPVSAKVKVLHFDLLSQEQSGWTALLKQFLSNKNVLERLGQLDSPFGRRVAGNELSQINPLLELKFALENALPIKTILDRLNKVMKDHCVVDAAFSDYFAKILGVTQEDV